jgi:hypothetical protein
MFAFFPISTHDFKMSEKRQRTTVDSDSGANSKKARLDDQATSEGNIPNFGLYIWRIDKTHCAAEC